MKNTIETAATNNMTEKEIIMKKRTGRIGKEVKCVETDKVYKNMAEAAREIGCSHDLISAVCRGRAKTAKGLHFKYYTETEIDNTKANEIADAVATPNPDTHTEHEVLIQPKSIVKGKGKRTNGNTKAVFDFTTGAFYTSGVDAAEIIGTTQGNISRVCNSRGRKANGHKICYVRNIPEHLGEIANSIHKANMYDEVKTKEEKRREMLALLSDLECKASCIQYEMEKLADELDKTNEEIEKVKNDLIYFNF